MEKNYKMVAKTFFGFEDILATELRNLGAMHVTKGVYNLKVTRVLCIRLTYACVPPLKF